MDAAPPPIAASSITADEIRLVDGQGRTRILLSARSETPVVRLVRPDGQTGAELTLAPDGHPAVKLANPDPNGPVAALEVDGKGAHVKFDRPGGGSSYLFLNNGGVSGVVLIDAKGVRRLDVILAPDGTPKIDRYGSDGQLLP